MRQEEGKEERINAPRLIIDDCHFSKEVSLIEPCEDVASEVETIEGFLYDICGSSGDDIEFVSHVALPNNVITVLELLVLEQGIHLQLVALRQCSNQRHGFHEKEGAEFVPQIEVLRIDHSQEGACDRSNCGIPLNLKRRMRTQRFVVICYRSICQEEFLAEVLTRSEGREKFFGALREEVRRGREGQWRGDRYREHYEQLQHEHRYPHKGSRG
jgi:hypothetical protein